MLTEQQKSAFVNVLKAWLSDSTKQDERLTVFKKILTEDQLTAFYVKILSDLAIVADLTVSQAIQQKANIDDEVASVDVSAIDTKVLTDVGITDIKK